ncbi:MAG: DUF448 domain-containing protein [Myxococcales bacterium]|nr:DUF448 domain-containing protein [Myxococcales bacterium]
MTTEGPPAKRVPQRTCVGCGEIAAQAEAIRFVSGDGRVVPDLWARLPGRGVYVHPRRDCFDKAARSGFARSLRRPISVSRDTMVQELCAQYDKRAEGLLVSARNARALAVGTDAVQDSLRAGKADLLVVARDARGRRDELVAKAAENGVDFVEFGTKVTLGALLDRDECGVVAVSNQSIARELKECVSRVGTLSEDR